MARDSSNYKSLADSFEHARLTRREILKRAAVLGLSIPATGALLAACETEDDDDVIDEEEPDDDPAADPDDDTVADDETTDDDLEDDDLQDDRVVTELEDDYLAASEDDPQYGGTLRVAGLADPAHWDLDQSATIANLWPQCTIYDNLVRFDPRDGGETIIPDLATDWEVGDDGLSYTFHLREGVQFHDGSEFSAEDVVATFTRRKDPPEEVVSIRRHLFEAVENIEAVDEYTVLFEMRNPAVFFVEAVATAWSVIFPAGAIEEHDGDFRRVVDVPGTGPYRFVEHQADEAFIVEKNEDYWNPNLPYLDRIERIVIPDSTDRGTAALTGEVDLADHVAVDTHLEAQERTEDVGTVSHVTTWAFTVTFNTQREPFDDPRVRRAVHLAISRQDLARAYELSDDIRVGTRWCHPSAPEALSEDEVLQLPGYRPDKEEDIEEAQRLMEEAGYGDGFDGAIFLMRGLSGPGVEIYAPAIQDMILQHLNIDCVIEPVDGSVYFDIVGDGDFHMTSGVPAAAINDPSDAWGQWYLTDGAQNFGQWSNEEFDDLLAQIEQELDGDRRRELVREAEDLLDQECPAFFHGWGNLPRIWSVDVHGIEQNLQGTYLTYRYDTVWLDR